MIFVLMSHFKDLDLYGFDFRIRAFITRCFYDFVLPSRHWPQARRSRAIVSKDGSTNDHGFPNWTAWPGRVTDAAPRKDELSKQQQTMPKKEE